MDQPVTRVLAEKPRRGEVASISPEATVAEAVRQMNEMHIGALLVVDDQEHHISIEGIFTERDVLVRVVAAGLDPRTTRVRQVMTPRVLVVRPDTTVEEAMRLMTERRFRHVPVVEGRRVIGLVSIGDLTRWVVRDQQYRIQDLEVYITRS
jgi:CBS domain-containing protein